MESNLLLPQYGDSMTNKLEKYIPIGLFASSAVYYWLLSSKIFTWIYTSGDAGDWLTLHNWWMVPQCWGKPLYVLLVKFTSLFPGDPILKITLLSVLAGALMIMLTYLIAKHFTNDNKLSLLAALVVLGCNMILSQATVLEQYTVFGALFLTFFYFYLKDKLLLAAIFLGMATAVHELGAVFTVLFIVVEFGRIKQLLKYAPVYLLFGLVPYIMIPIMMVADTPKLLAGYLTWDSLSAWTGNTTVTAALALTESPKRFWEMLMVLTTGLGFAVVPTIIGLRPPYNKVARLILVCFGFSLWFYFTNLFPSTWKFITPTIPLIVCLGVVALKNLPKWQTMVTLIGACALIITNVFCFNSNIIAQADPQATTYYKALWELPDGAALITPRGGAYGFSIFRAMSEGKNIIPLALSKPDLDWHDKEGNAGFQDYLIWLEKNYGISGENTYDIVTDAQAKGHPVYFATPMTKTWAVAFKFERNEQGYLYKVIRAVENPVWESALIESPIAPFFDYWRIKEKKEKVEDDN